MKEVWTPIPLYDGLYHASSLGRIKSTPRTKVMPYGTICQTKERVLAPAISPAGYLAVNLWFNGKKKTHTVHRLIMLAFNGKSDLCVDHINELKTDNRLENLRYCTYRQNTGHFYLKRKMDSNYVGVQRAASGRWKAVICIKNKKYWIGTFDTQEEAFEQYKNKLKSIPA